MYIFALMDTLKKQEIALSALIWVAVFAAVPLIFGYYYVSGRDFVFQWQEMLMTWGAMLPFLALFLCHDLAVYPFLKSKITSRILPFWHCCWAFSGFGAFTWPGRIPEDRLMNLLRT